MKPRTSGHRHKLAFSILSFAGCLTSWASIDSSSFAPPFDLVTGVNPFQVASADLDADGRRDLVTTDLSGNDVSVFRNIGPSGALSPASFDPAVMFGVGAAPTGIAIGDIDGDGKPDLVVANFSNNSISILRNTTTTGAFTASTFGSNVEFSTGSSPAAVVIVDLDMDGKLDIAVANEAGSSISVFRNVSAPGSITVSSLAPRLDLGATGRPLAIAAGDLDGDGKLELVTADDSGSTVSVLKNSSTPGSLSFAPAVDFVSGGSPQSLAVGDVDGDGKPELVVANFNGSTVSVLRNQTSSGVVDAGSFAAAVEFPVGSNPRGVVLADLDNDGKRDVVTSNFGNGTLSVLANLGVLGSVNSGSFGSQVVFSAGPGAFILEAADLDQDGKRDLMVANLSANTVSVLKNLSGPSSPSILVPPQSQTVIVGDNVTFTVSASGSPAPTYQWKFNGNNISGANSPVLTLNNVQLSQSGNYSVTVANSLGSVTSASALLTVNLGPSQFRIINSAVLAGQRVKLPVWAKLNGTENTVGFSLQFDPAALKFVRADAGPGTPPQMTLNANTNLAASGSLGFGLGMPAGSTFVQRTQAVLFVTLEATATAPSGATPIAFSDSPIDRQVASPLASLLPVEFFDGQVTIQSLGFEGDVSPDASGDQRLQIIDWVMVGRFAAGLSVPVSPGQYQRADCAPRTQRGNGQLTVADWVQAGRYATGLDPITAAAGPTRANGGGNPPPPFEGIANVRSLKVGDVSARHGEWVEVPVSASSVGNEHALGFSLSFNPAQLEFSAATLAIAAQGATLNLNSDQAKAGVLGMVLALPWGGTLHAGNQEIVRLKFRILPSAEGALCPLSVQDSPAQREIVDLEANALSCTFESGGITLRDGVGALPLLTLTRTTEGLLLTWPRVGSETFQLEVSPSSGSPVWSAVTAAVTQSAEDNTLRITPDSAAQYYRLIQR